MASKVLSANLKVVGASLGGIFEELFEGSVEEMPSSFYFSVKALPIFLEQHKCPIKLTDN